MRKYLIEDTGLLSPDFNPDQIYVRSTDVYRTISSTLAHLQGLYEGSTTLKLSLAQESILPLFKIRKEISEEANKNFGTSPLPNDLVAVPVHMPVASAEYFWPDKLFKSFGAMSYHLVFDGYIENTLTQKYQEHVDAYGEHYFGIPYGIAALEEITSSDTVYSHWYDRRSTPGIN